ncbi:phytoene desaturase family protein [Mangrovivirga sp. M17]|uniref:Phytoene desaturase family protein n=1 Tax=Mangrovivirga halotolerans TaxID=2993936 RepID=A0ABT3RT11_9BACT|nr:phytoene desaturase family protein [Mangrovivirga halotolerans]MCX2744723.1 phytoene desaturase family protein [Mangrovivirga halotolerans]
MNRRKYDAVVIGSGFSGLAAACYLAKDGFKTVVVEKNDTPGGRARHFSEKGFVFDMGPSWYWMPDVFEHFFASFGKTPSDYYNLIRLDPSYKVIYKDSKIDIPANWNELKLLFDKLEPGSSKNLEEFMRQAEIKYKVGMNDFVYKPGHSFTEFLDLDLLKKATKLDIFSSIGSHIRKFFKNKELIQLMEFPILFLGALPKNTPSLYSMMNYADMKLGTWYPEGGMHKIIEGMVSLANELGVEIHTNEEVKNVEITNNKISSLQTSSAVYEADNIICSADYHHFEQTILPKQYRRYTEKYWEKRKLAPSCLLFYIGVDKKLNNLEHHNLFFDADFEKHTDAIYGDVKWPDDPLFYTCVPSKTDSTVAPEGKENIFILIPMAPGLIENNDISENYYKQVISRLEKHCGENIKDHVIYKRSYGAKNFITDYHAYKGNAYGLANTLDQTAILKPKMKNKKLNNLLYTGQLTVPGPGVPPSLISGEIVASEVIKEKSGQLA